MVVATATAAVSNTHNAEPKSRTAKEVQKEAKRIIEVSSPPPRVSRSAIDPNLDSCMG